MGRRSRKRTQPGAAPTAGVQDDVTSGAATPRDRRREADAPGRFDTQRSSTAPRSRRAHLDEAPPPPWAPVPLTEIMILLGLVALGFALLGGDDVRPALLVTGFVLVTVATFELSLREHLAGYRSHSALLAGLAAVLVAAPVALWVRPAKAVVLVVGAAVFALGVQLLRELFRRRSGGMGWRA